jgi:hypothetical protein
VQVVQQAGRQTSFRLGLGEIERWMGMTEIQRFRDTKKKSGQ